MQALVISINTTIKFQRYLLSFEEIQDSIWRKITIKLRSDFIREALQGPYISNKILLKFLKNLDYSYRESSMEILRALIIIRVLLTQILKNEGFGFCLYC